jgi:hypothetical protein
MWSRTRAAADTRKGTEKGDPTAQVPFALRADDKVEVIGHQVVAENIQKEPGARVDSGTDKGALVPGLVKDNLSTIDTIEDVRPPAADGIAGSSWHAAILKQAGLSVNLRRVPGSWPLVSGAVYLRHGLLAPAHHFPHGHVAEKVAETGVSPQTGNNSGWLT